MGWDEAEERQRNVSSARGRIQEMRAWYFLVRESSTSHTLSNSGVSPLTVLSPSSRHLCSARTVARCCCKDHLKRATEGTFGRSLLIRPIILALPPILMLPANPERRCRVTCTVVSQHLLHRRCRPVLKNRPIGELSPVFPPGAASHLPLLNIIAFHISLSSTPVLHAAPPPPHTRAPAGPFPSVSAHAVLSVLLLLTSYA